MIILLVAIQHLPDKHSPLYEQIKQIFNKIFNENNVLYGWGDVLWNLNLQEIMYHLIGQ